MKPTLVGSRALQYWDPSFKPRDGADWDIINNIGVFMYPPSCTEKVKDRIESHSYSELNNEAVCKLYTSEKNTLNINGAECYVLEPQGLALMKRSHLWRAYHFEKHITMYHKYLSRYALWDDPQWVALLDERTKLTKKAYPQRNPDLTQTNKDFFDDAVSNRHYDHDWLHEQVAYYERPLFERLKKPEGADKAWCERDLWELLSSDDKNKCVAEEAHVIAVERFMIPNNWKFPHKLAYYKAVNKICTTLCSGWFREHSIDHFPEIIRLFDMSKFNKVQRVTTGVN
jgi:hypothetical protein